MNGIYCAQSQKNRELIMQSWTGYAKLVTIKVQVMQHKDNWIASKISLALPHGN